MLLGWATPVLGSSAHILIDVQNNALVKKAQWQDFHRAESGMTLSSDCLLYTSPSPRDP